MADSVDRVFSHALNTVNKIRTGSQKPPSATRLRLYGLYKQAMEGDVDGIMERPAGATDEQQRAREKWDAWKQQNGLSRTEAKRRYITTLIDTMHKYASPSPDSRELVAELEFVWDQVKSNVPSSSSSSPLQTLSQLGMHSYTSQQLGQSGRAAMAGDDQHGDEEADSDQPLQIKSPMSQSEEELEEEEADIDREDEFVDAQDSQYNPLSDAGVQTDLQLLLRQEPIPIVTPTPAPRARGLLPSPLPLPTFSGKIIATQRDKDKDPKKDATNDTTKGDAKWRTRIEHSLIKMTAEVAALREQLEARRLFSHAPHYRFLRAIWRFAWAAIKHVAVDVFILGLVLLFLRRKKDRRLEGAVRVLAGGAVAQVQKSGVQLGKVVKMPGLGGGAKKGAG